MKRALTTLCFCTGLSLSTWAQLPPPPTPTAPPSQVPLDGGVLLLAAAGAVYGAKKVYHRKKTGN